MRVPFLAAWIVLLAAVRMPAENALTGTWSPDQQIAVTEEHADDSKWRCYFRDQRTGANLGDVPLHDPRPAGGEVLMQAAWNFDGTRVALLIVYGKQRRDVRFFRKDETGRLRPVKIDLPDPARLYQRRTGKIPPRRRDDFDEAALGPWSSDDTIQVILGRVWPSRKTDRWQGGFTDFDVRFHAKKAVVAKLHFEAIHTTKDYREWIGGLNMCYFILPPKKELRAFPIWEDSSEDQIIVGRDDAGEQANPNVDLQSCAEKYHADFGEFPQGDNREITRQLLGLNPKRKIYESLLMCTLDRNGVPVDAWGEPCGFEFDEKNVHARVLSERLERTCAEWDNGRRWPSSYDAFYNPDKKEMARRGCYQLAAGILLAERQEGQVLPATQLVDTLCDSLLGLSTAERKEVLCDP